MATRMILIRHGDTGYEWGTFVGSTDVPLKPGAEERAKELGKRLGEEGIIAVYSSKLQRAARTADSVAGELGLEVRERFSELNEADFGRWEMKRIEDIRRTEPELLVMRSKDFWKFRGHGGESAGDVRERALPVLEMLMKRHEGETFAVVAHGSLIKAMRSVLVHKEVRDWKSARLRFLAAIFFKKDGDKIEVEKEWGVR